MRPGGETCRREGELLLSTRRGKQFNSMVQGRVDPLTGAARDHVLLSAEDARLHTAALPCPLLVRGGQIGARAGRLSALLPEVATRYPELVALDLRFARRIVVQPAEPSTGEPGEGDEA